MDAGHIIPWHINYSTLPTTGSSHSPSPVVPAASVYLTKPTRVPPPQTYKSLLPQFRILPRNAVHHHQPVSHTPNVMAHSLIPLALHRTGQTHKHIATSRTPARPHIRPIPRNQPNPTHVSRIKNHVLSYLLTHPFKLPLSTTRQSMILLSPKDYY